MKISIFYGTETGNAEMLAEDLKMAMEDEHDLKCANLSETDPSDVLASSFNIFVCSTYGDGDLPASAVPFVEKLAGVNCDLSHVYFAVFGLGDSEYAETFAFGPKSLAEKLSQCGATQIGHLGIHDASGGELAEDIALPWLHTLLASDEVLSRGF